MPRRSSGRSATRSAPRAARVRNPPRPVSQASPPAPVQRSGGSFLGTVAQGVAFGAGSAVAHRVVDAVMGPRTVQHESVGSEAAAAAPMTNAVGADSCSIHSKAFQECINSNGADISKCQFYLDLLNECRRGSGSMGTLRDLSKASTAGIQSLSGNGDGEGMFFTSKQETSM